MNHCCFAGCDTCPTCGGCRRFKGFAPEGCTCGSSGCGTIPLAPDWPLSKENIPDDDPEV